MRLKIVCLLVFSLLSGCLGFATKDKLVGNYYLVAPDDDEQLGLCYYDIRYPDGCCGIVGETVFAAGYNDKYIIVKQHPRAFPHPPNKKITNFFIVSIKGDSSYYAKGNVIGPLTLAQFNAKKKELNITNVEFTVENERLK